METVKYDLGSSVYAVREVICIECKLRWVAGTNEKTQLRGLECPRGHIGFVIATGCGSILEGMHNEI